jgi:RHS repeat-associated protein
MLRCGTDGSRTELGQPKTRRSASGSELVGLTWIKNSIAGVATHIAVKNAGAPITASTRYLHKDHLGSMDVITNESGAVIQRLSFDVWGKRRENTGWAAYAAGNPGYAWQNEPITRGYTGHEQLDPVGLVHMNGRVYDPEIGRFLSADPFIQDVTNSQALNSYSYVLNNPVSMTDPSGFFFSSLFKAIGKFFSAVARAFIGAIKSIVRSAIGRAILQIIACAGPQAVATCVAASVALTLAAGGTIKQALIAGAISFAQIASYSVIHGIVGSIANPVLAGITKLTTHAIVGGAFSVAQGGSFAAGAAAGAVSAAGALMMEGTALGAIPGQQGLMVRTAISAVLGGTTSVLAGGKFANGAITGAFGYLYNAAGLAGYGQGTNAQPGNAKAVAMFAAAAACSGAPPCGEGMDLYTLYAPESSVWEKLGAGVSLAISVITAGLSPNLGPFINLASSKRTAHILHGDATGGGHLSPGASGKTPFPADWSAERVMHEISDVATDPASVSNISGGGRTVVMGTRDGVDIKVVVDKNGSDIVTGHPTNLPRKP